MTFIYFIYSPIWRKGRVMSVDVEGNLERIVMMTMVLVMRIILDIERFQRTQFVMIEIFILSTGGDQA